MPRRRLEEEEAEGQQREEAREEKAKEEEAREEEAREEARVGAWGEQRMSVRHVVRERVPLSRTNLCDDRQKVATVSVVGPFLRKVAG